MTVKTRGVDIIAEIGGIHDEAAATALFQEKLDSDHLARLQRITDPAININIANAIAMCQPEAVFINTGSEEDRAFIRAIALTKGEEEALPMQGHTIHFDLKDEQGRIIDRTYYIADPDEKVSSLANRMERTDALDEISRIMSGIMHGKTMVVGFYMRGPVGSPVSNPALEITSSAYVSHSAEILYRNAYARFNEEVERLGHFYTNVHSEGLNRPEDLPSARVFMDRSYRTTFSFNCTYAGNTLLLKKGNHRFSVDKAVYENRGNELSEHMFITGIDGPGGRRTWCTGAAPSGCGKTTTAMAGNHFVGDDLAQMWIADDGSIRSVNPECGIFGIVEDVNREGDPMLMDILRNQGHEVIWSNVLIDKNGLPHWVGNGESAPEKGRNFQGDWYAGKQNADGNEVPLSHPNSRCTVSSTSLANYSEKAEDAKGVETRVITYSGRDSDTMPPVWAAKNPDHGVAIGACIVSAATATEVIWSNVLIDKNGLPHWVGNGESAPEKGRNFQGDWYAGKQNTDGNEVPLSHPNSRCTVSSTSLDNYSEKAEDPKGVETRVITYSGRDSDTMPPVWAAKNPDHGVAIGACIVSAATATEVGAIGVKRAPWANAPFIPGALGDYMDAQFSFFNSPKIAENKKPVMAGLNYFLTHAARGGESQQLLGEKKDVKVWLAWLERKAHDDVEAIETPIGFLPKLKDLQALFDSIIAKAYTEDLYTRQFSLYIDNIIARIDLQTKAYGKEENIPQVLFQVLEEQKKGLTALREKYGPVVTPEQLQKD